MTQTIYFDESGFTGNHLSDPDQPIFVYASVAIDREFALDVHSEAVSSLGERSGELKGKRLVRRVRGREVISRILDRVRYNSYAVAVDKEYALAGKFFEYIFEPVLAPRSSLFYGIDFNKFIATLLCISARAKVDHAEKILEDFENLMRTRDPRHFDTMLSPMDTGFDPSNPLGRVLTFALCHEKSIMRELRGMDRVLGNNTWILELSATSLHQILSYWGEKFDAMDIYCDESKPIKENLSIFDSMIGREDKAYIHLGGKQMGYSFIYNLSNSVRLVDSKEYPGVQIADVLASSIAHALKNPGLEESQEWLSIMGDEGGALPIGPEVSYIDLNRIDTAVNSLVLQELVDRSIKGESLLIDMAEFVVATKGMLLATQPSIFIPTQDNQP